LKVYPLKIEVRLLEQPKTIKKIEDFCEKYIFAIFIFSILGVLLAAIIHTFTLFNISIVNDSFSFLLGFGMFLPWFAAISFMNKTQREEQSFNIIPFFMNNTPLILKIFGIAVFVYAFANFNYTVNLYNGVPGIVNGQYVIQNHGEVTQVLTKEQYDLAETNQLRLSTGHQLAFWGIAMVAIYSRIKKQKNVNKKIKISHSDNLQKIKYLKLINVFSILFMIGFMLYNNAFGMRNFALSSLPGYYFINKMLNTFISFRYFIF
jgi:hypothetical protein